MGNNYESCEITAKNALKDYPSNSYQEELSWLVFLAKYQQMVNSFEDKKMDRARDTQDEYYSFITEFPNSKHRKEADKIFKELRKKISDWVIELSSYRVIELSNYRIIEL